MGFVSVLRWRNEMEEILEYTVVEDSSLKVVDDMSIEGSGDNCLRWYIRLGSVLDRGIFQRSLQ